MNIESKIAHMLFFTSVKNGFFDYEISIKPSLMKFNKNKTIELSPSLLEYLCYKIVKNRLLTDNFTNTDIVLFTEKFLSLDSNKNIFKLTNKQHIIILFQDEITKKWSLIMFLNLKEQINNLFNSNNKKTIVTNIISSFLNEENENYFLNKTFDNFEKILDFKLPIVNFEVKLVNINDQKNTSIFLLNFIEGLICQDNDSIALYIQKLFDKDIYKNNNDMHKDYMDYFNSFDKISDFLENILPTYEKELNEYLKKNKDYEKYFNGNNIVMKNELKKNEENKFEKGKNNGCDNNNSDDDSDFNFEDEEEVLRIMEYQHKKSKQRKFIKNDPTYRLNLKSINYKNIGIIKEEEHESSSESVPPLSIVKYKRNSKKYLTNLDNNIKTIAHNKKEELRKMDFNKINDNINNEINIKKTILKELEEAVNEFEKEQSSNSLTKKNKIGKMIKKNTANLFISNIQKEKQKKNKIKKTKKSADDKEKQRPNSSIKLFEGNPKNINNYKKIINCNIFKNYKFINQSVKNFNILKKNLIHPKGINDLMKKLEKKDIKNNSLHRNNNIRKYNLGTIFKNKSFILENNISKLLKGNINRKDSIHKLVKKNSNIKEKNKKSKKKSENIIKTSGKAFKKYSNLINSTKLSNISQRSTFFQTEDSIKKIKENKKQKKNIRVFEIEKENTHNLSLGNNILQPKEANSRKIINKTNILNKNKYDLVKIMKKFENNDNMIADNEKSAKLNIENILSLEEFKVDEKKNQIKIDNISNKNGNKYFNRKLINSSDCKHKRNRISIQDYNFFEKNEQKKYGCNFTAHEVCNVF